MDANYNVLIVDDHLLFREGLEALLKGVININDVFLAGSSVEAESTLLNHTIHLIFMDIKLDKESGIELTYKVRKTNPKVKIIGVSMYADKSNLLKMINAGANGYLPKNTSFKEVNEAIQSVINGENYFSESVMASIRTENISATVQNNKAGIYSALSNREQEVLKFICLGLTSVEVAARLNISPKTVEAHRHNIISKMGAKNMAEVILHAVDNGILKTNL